MELWSEGRVAALSRPPVRPPTVSEGCTSRNRANVSLLARWMPKPDGANPQAMTS